jgi:hypothetical protein
MRRISSKATFFHKYVVPVIWLALLLAIAAVGLMNGFVSFVVWPIVLMAFGYFAMKRFFAGVVDEVSYAGDALLVRNNNEVGRVPLSEVMDVSSVQYPTFSLVTLKLKEKLSIFGTEIVFCAPSGFPQFSMSPIVDELIKKADAARSPQSSSWSRRS